MNPDALKAAWQSQTSQRHVTIDAEALLREVRRNERHFKRIIFWRDVQEVGVSLVLVPVWIWLGRSHDLPWTWYLCIPTLLWISAFMVVDRIRQRRWQPKPGDALRARIESSLAQVEHQIWLLRNVFWWYLLPPGVAVAAFFAQCAWLARDLGWKAGFIVAGVVAVAALILWGVYWMNQTAVRDELEPRRLELQRLIASFDDANHAGELSGLITGSVRPPTSSKWSRVYQIFLSCFVLALIAWFVFDVGKVNRREEPRVTPPGVCPAAGDAALTNLLVQIRQKYNVPAICAAFVTSKGVTAVGVAGARKRGTDIPATLADLWHLGSDTKAMTAILVARLVEQKRLKWDTTMAEVFPELADKFHAEMRGVTLLYLLSHRAGLPANLNLANFSGDDVVALRLRAVREELARPPQRTPGSHYEYSNLGYIIAGAVVERITGKTWEDAIREEVFAPLRMNSAGFGGTGTRGQIDQPWPHHADGEPMLENGPAMDNPPVMGPAGRVHSTIQDWAKFIQDQLRGDRGELALLKPETYQTLHKPPFGGDYALGWIVVQREWGGGTVFNHAGDNTMNFANVWIAPQRDFAILVCVNQSGDMAFKATDEAVVALMKLHGEKPPAK